MGEFADDLIDSFVDDWLDEEDEYFSNRTVNLRVKGHNKHNADGQPVTTNKAILWVCDDGEEAWLPYSQIVAIHPDSVTITSWLARKRGWPKQPDNEDSVYDLNDDLPF